MTIMEQNTMIAIQQINEKLQELTLRDLFAMSALTGTLRGTTYTDGEIKIKAEQSYRIADAMLEERKK